MYQNAKYTDWSKVQINRNDVETYIGLHIFPEDIELFMNVLNPPLTVYQDSILKIPTACSEDELTDIKKTFDDLLTQFHVAETEKLMNYISVIDIFINTHHATQMKTFHNIAKLIKMNWEMYFQTLFPERKIQVAISLDDEPTLTFYELR